MRGLDEAAVTAIFAAVQSVPMRLGIYDNVLTHEPKSAPSGWSVGMWIDYLGPLPRTSGLDYTSALMAFIVRSYTSALAQPLDDIDPRITAAVSTMMAAYSAGFTLDGTVMAVDLLGMSGRRMEARAGYVHLGQSWMRVVDLTLPIIVAGAWQQGA